MMKKTLALLLAVLMIFSTFVFTTAAEETTATTATQTAETIIPVYDFESLAQVDMTASPIRELSDVNPYSGNYSLGTTFTGIATSVAKVGFAWSDKANPIDITGMQVLCFAVYLENAKGVRNANFDAELRTPEFYVDGTTEIEANCTVNLQLHCVSGELKDGWNLIEIPISSFNNSHNIDYTRISYVRLFNSNPGKNNATGKCTAVSNILGTEGETTTVKFDSLYFSSTASRKDRENYFDFY